LNFQPKYLTRKDKINSASPSPDFKLFNLYNVYYNIDHFKRKSKKKDNNTNPLQNRNKNKTRQTTPGPNT